MEELLSISASLLGVASISPFVRNFFERLLKRGESTSLAEKIDAATTQLRAAAGLVDVLDTEIRNRFEKAEALKTKIDEYQGIKSLSEEQIKAVSIALRGQFAEHEKKSLRSAVLMNFLMLTLGASISFGISWAFSTTSLPKNNGEPATAEVEVEGSRKEELR